MVRQYARQLERHHWPDRMRATDPVWLDDVQVYPDAASRQITVKMRLGNVTQTAGGGSITVSAKGKV